MSEVKRCTCCNESITAEQWAALPTVGEWRFGDGEPVLLLKNHSCGSTLAIEMEVE